MLHWDLMLEIGEALRTWRLAAPPAEGLQIVATPLGDHRLAYLEHEGPVSGNRGNVRQWDRGDFELLENGDQRTTVRLRGQRLNGTATLQIDAADWSFHYVAERLLRSD